MMEDFTNDTLQDIGRITVHSGSVRFCLLSAIDALLSTRLGDQGIGRLTLRDANFDRLCEALHRIAVVAGLSEDAISEIQVFASQYSSHLQLASSVSSGMWTSLSCAIEDIPAVFGLFQDTVLRDRNFHPDWRQLSTDDIRQLADNLSAANEAACSILHIAQTSSSNHRRRNESQ